MDLALMLGQLDVAPLVPEQYARYRPVVSEGISFFLSRLSPVRLEAIIQEQMLLPLDAGAAQRVVHVLHHCPALHKLGQVVARRRELEEGFRRRLQQLESMQPRTPMSEVSPIITRELDGAIERHHLRIEPQALAEASVAVVIPFTWPSGSVRNGDSDTEGVFKVLKPGIEECLAEDLHILGELSDHLDAHWKAYGLPEIDYRDTFDEVRDILSNEVLTEREQRHLAHAATMYRGHDDVHVPRVLPFCTPGLTAMERLRGVKVTELCGKERGCGERLARSVVRALVADVLFSREDGVMFHGDPHAGNLMATSDGRVGILDWSLAGELTLQDRIQLAQMLVGAFALDGQRIATAFEALASAPPGEEKLSRLVGNALADVRNRGFPDLRWMMELLDSAAHAGVRFRQDLMLFRKAYFTLEGVVSDLCPTCTMQRILVEAAMEELAGEWPLRLMRTPWSRDYPTHLSNADLMLILACMPGAAMNWWASKGLPGLMFPLAQGA